MSRLVPIEEVKYIFNPVVLRPGDILLMNTYEEDFRAKLKCKYEHAAIYVGDAYIMEANGLHVVMSHVYSYAFREREHVCVLRHKGCSPITLEDVARAAHEQMGKDYINTTQFRYVRALKNTDHKDTTNMSFCSRLVAQSYDRKGIKLLPNADYCEPDDFLNSPLLEEVHDGVMPFTEELTDVIMNNQADREQNEMDSPNSEMFDSLSAVYGENIQELEQVMMASIHHPERDEEAIAAIKTSRMFKHKEMVTNQMPWFWNDKDFLEHYQDSTKALHLIYSQINHYDHTIIKDYRELHLQLITVAHYRPDCKIAIFLRDYIQVMVEEAIECRKRLEYLYELMQRERADDFKAFADKYGLYLDYKYVARPIDISFIIKDVMRAWEDSAKEGDSRG